MSSINSISINGYKAIREIEVEPNGKHVEITGANRKGKSSFMDAVFLTLTGAKVPEGVVNDECIKAKVVLGLSDGHTVTWACKKSSNPTLKVERDDGEPITGGDRTYLNNLIGSVGEDPLELARMAPGDQKKKIQKILKLDFTDLDQAKVKSLAAIKDVAAKVKAYAQQLDQLGNVSKVDPVDVNDLLAKQQTRNEAAEKGRALGENYKAENALVDSAVDTIENTKSEIDGLTARLAQLQENLKGAEVALTERQGALNLAANELDEARKAYLLLEDPTPAIAAASDTNRKAQLWEQASKLQETHAKAEEELEKAKEADELVDAERVKRLTNVEFPVDGLEFTEDGILYKGRPFNDKSQCTSDIMKVGLALQVISNPGLKVVRISRGSELDAESKAQVLSILSKHGFQALIETVTSGDARAIVLESTPETTEEGAVDA